MIISLVNQKGGVGKGAEGISFAIPIKTALEEFERYLR